MSITPSSDYSQRQSDNLMNIVAVVYGVALTTALTSHQEVLLHPLSATNILPFMALSAAGILTAFSFYIYVLSIGGGKPYVVDWDEDSMASRAIFRFATDFVLAILYVRLLFTAADVQSGPRAAPKLAGFVFSFFLVFVGAVVVRWVRSEAISVPGLIAAAASLGLWFFTPNTIATRFSIPNIPNTIATRLSIPNTIATRDFDLGVAAGAALGVIVYCWLNYRFIYHKWINANRSSAGAATQSAGAAAQSAVAAAQSAVAAAQSAGAAAQSAANTKDVTS
jgi:hypothetical protein